MQTAIPTRDEIVDWTINMPSKEKDTVIAALIESSDSHVTVAIRQHAVREIQNARNPGGNAVDHERRSIDQLDLRANAIAAERQTRESAARARAKAKREQEQAEARKVHLESLAGKEDSLWSKVDTLVVTKQPKRYDGAVSILQDLRDQAAMAGQDDEFSSRMEALIRKHARKPSLLERFRKAMLMKSLDLARESNHLLRKG